MAQGAKLLKKSGAGGKQSQKSVASAKKQQKKQLNKGRKVFQAKGVKAIQSKQIQDATKDINKKNEIKMSAKAISAGHTFFMNDIKESGKKEINRQNQNLMKKEKGTNKLSSRLKEQLRKMGKDI